MPVWGATKSAIDYGVIKGTHGARVSEATHSHSIHKVEGGLISEYAGSETHPTNVLPPRDPLSPKTPPETRPSYVTLEG